MRRLAPDFEPCVLVLHGRDRCSITFSDTPETAGAFLTGGIDPGGYSWDAVVDVLLGERAPEIRQMIVFDSEAGMFAASGPLAALRAIARVIREAVSDPTMLARAIEQARGLRS